jgi:hypothetical protein
MTDEAEKMLNASSSSHSKLWNRGVISPESRFMQSWDLVMLSLLGYTAFVTTYEIVFVVEDGMNYNAMFFINRLADMGFVTDIGINFNLSFRDPNTNLWVLDKKLIAWKYCQGWFLIDILGTIPYSLLAPGNAVGILRFLRLIRLVKLLRILRASRIIHRLMRSLNWSMSTWAFIRTGVLLLVSIHWTSCLWYMLTVFESGVTWKSEIEQKANLARAAFEEDGLDDDEDNSTMRRYLKASKGGGGGDDLDVVTAIDTEINWYRQRTPSLPPPPLFVQHIYTPCL